MANHVYKVELKTGAKKRLHGVSKVRTDSMLGTVVFYDDKDGVIGIFPLDAIEYVGRSERNYE